MVVLKVDALSSSTNNARQISDAIMAMPAEAGAPRLVLIGYSKGAPDILEVVVAYPEIRRHVAAVVSRRDFQKLIANPTDQPCTPLPNL